MTASPRRWPDAVLLGFAASMRTLTPVAVLAARGRIGGRARPLAYALAAGEMAQDKTPFARERVDGPSTAARVGSGAATGAALAGPPGAAAGAVGAGLGTFATFRARKLLGAATGLPDPLLGAAEDVVAVTASVVATREQPAEAEHDAPPRRPVLPAAARGLAAGAAGTAAMTVAQGFYYQVTGAQPSSAPRQVADKLGTALGLGRVPRKRRTEANLGMHWLYGTSWGIPYGILAGTRDPRGGRVELSGVAFGLGVWAAGLAQLPALGLAPVPWKQEPFHLALDLGFHLVYGLGAAGALRALTPR